MLRTARVDRLNCRAPAQIWDATGAEVSSNICKILGGDAGFADTVKDWPRSGLLTDVAYRWDVVRPCPNSCDAPLYGCRVSTAAVDDLLARLSVGEWLLAAGNFLFGVFAEVL